MSDTKEEYDDNCGVQLRRSAEGRDTIPDTIQSLRRPRDTINRRGTAQMMDVRAGVKAQVETSLFAKQKTDWAPSHGRSLRFKPFITHQHLRNPSSAETRGLGTRQRPSDRHIALCRSFLMGTSVWSQKTRVAGFALEWSLGSARRQERCAAHAISSGQRCRHGQRAKSGKAPCAWRCHEWRRSPNEEPTEES